MIKIDKEKIGGNIRANSEDDTAKVNINIDRDFGRVRCEGEECKLPDWAAHDQ